MRGSKLSTSGLCKKHTIELQWLNSHLNEEVLVVELLELLEERSSEGEGVGEPLGLVVEADQARFEALSEEGAALLLGPVDALL